jgi:hypothetical protein
MPPDAFNASAKKKRKRSYTAKIRWELLGLPASEPPSIEVIRNAVAALAVTRFAREPIPKPSEKAASKPSLRKRRYKAVEPC